MAGILESINMASTGGATRIFDCVAEEVIENGMVGGLNGLADGYSHIYKFAKGAPEKNTYVIVDQPAWDEDTSKITNQRRDKFVIPAGTPFRARVLAVGDEFGINLEGFTMDSQSEAKVGAYAVVDASGKFKAQAAKPGSGSYCQIMRKRIAGGTLATAAHNYGRAMDIYELRVVC